MTENQARDLIRGLSKEQKQALNEFLKNLAAVKDKAEAFQAGFRAGIDIQKGAQNNDGRNKSNQESDQSDQG